MLFFFLQKEIDQKERLLQQLKYKLEETQNAQVGQPGPAQRSFINADHHNIHCCCRLIRPNHRFYISPPFSIRLTNKASCSVFLLSEIIGGFSFTAVTATTAYLTPVVAAFFQIPSGTENNGYSHCGNPSPSLSDVGIVSSDCFIFTVGLCTVYSECHISVTPTKALHACTVHVLCVCIHIFMDIHMNVYP